MRGIIDFNLHLPAEPRFDQDLDLQRFDATSRAHELVNEIRGAGLAAGNVMLLDTSMLRREHAELLSILHSAGLRTTIMIDPRDPDAYDLVDVAAAAGASGVKIHPYFLNLADHDFPLALGLAQRAAAQGLWTAVCCSYGTKRLYSVSGVRLLAAIAQAVRDAPLIALHAGGKLVLDVMSIALDSENVFLETSFSIPFWLGSSIETDFVFAMKKTGLKRWLYGSDHPYVDLVEAQKQILEFCSRHALDEAEVQELLAGTAADRLWPWGGQ